MLVSDLSRVMQNIAPLEYAQGWDKVGLLVGDAQAEIRGPVMLTIDLTEPVLNEAVQAGAGAIIAYHPPIFEPLTKVTAATPRQRVILRAIEHRLAIYSPHTALDAVPGGMTDWLCEGLSGGEPGRIRGDCRALQSHATLPPTQELKIVTFVPAREAENVRNALASAGAGIIGEYSVCAFAVNGVGTFMGSSRARPAIGTPEHLEKAEEIRLEMVCGDAALPLALETLRRFHPYETPAIDVYTLTPQPRRGAGSGRRLVLDRPCTVGELAQRFKTFIRRDRVRYALPWDDDRPISRVGVVPGAGESLSRVAREEGCEVFVTGEMKHHDVLGALNAGMAIILGGHTSTERGYLPRLAARLAEAGFSPLVSQRDRDPLVTV